MRRRVVVCSVTLLLVALIGVGVVRLSRGGYLPVDRGVTASSAPTSVPLATATATAVPTAVGAPELVATEAKTPRGDTPAATPTQEPAPAVGTVVPTRIVPPPSPIQLPEGFGISVFAQGLSDPRMMALGDDGEVYVAERGANRVVRLPDRDDDGVADSVEVVAGSLTVPSSIAFSPDGGSLYVGETRRVLRLSLAGDPLVADRVETVVDGLPSGGHSTRTVLLSPDGAWLYVSVGSSCNICLEEDPRRAAVVRYRAQGGAETVFATGLRNAVGMAFRPGTSELWVTNNGRDRLGDDQPPETVYLVGEGDDAGWPRCHSGRIIDPDYGTAGDCDGVLAPVVEMQAHSAPLGLTFYTGTQFPETYLGGLFVAFHGSWNRSEPTGYKVVYVPVESTTSGVSGRGGAGAGPVMDFATGWLQESGSQWGRPVDVLTGGDGSLLVSDDYGGRIFRIFHDSAVP